MTSKSGFAQSLLAALDTTEWDPRGHTVFPLNNWTAGVIRVEPLQAVMAAAVGPSAGAAVGAIEPAGQTSQQQTVSPDPK
jgi:hypothetical protein